MDLRLSALHALCLVDPEEKVAATYTLYAQAASLSIATGIWPTPPEVPGRPSRPELFERIKKPQRSLFMLEGRAALVHSIAHIEFNAIKSCL